MNNLYFKYRTIWHCKNNSGKLKQIKKIVKTELKGLQYGEDKKGNIFIGDFSKNLPCLVAHLDSVFDKKPKVIRLSYPQKRD